MTKIKAEPPGGKAMLRKGDTGILKRELKEIPLFADLDETQISRVVDHMQLHPFEKGEKIFEQGEPAEDFFVVRRGQVKLFRLSQEGQEKIIELIQSGQTFAESLMFMGRGTVYPVHAEAIDCTELLAVDNQAFKAILRESPDTCFRLMASMSRRLHQQVNEIDRLTLHDATYRLISFLLEQLPEGVVHSPNVFLSTTKHIIASRLSIQPETFSRILSRLTQKGLIEVHGHHIVLRDIPALREMVRL